jgi:hypothetical protein
LTLVGHYRVFTNGLRRVERRLPQPSHPTYDIADLHDIADLNLRWPVALNIFSAAMCLPIPAAIVTLSFEGLPQTSLHLKRGLLPRISYTAPNSYYPM